MIQPVKQEITTEDGQKIVAQFFLPRREVRAAVLIAPAMGTSQEYYGSFAKWLAGEAFLVGTFDYRGTGLSQSAS